MVDLKDRKNLCRALIFAALALFAVSTAFAAEQSEAFKQLASQRKAELQASDQKAPAVEKAPVAKKTESATVPEAEAEEVPMVELDKKGTVTGVSRQGFAVEYAVDKKAGGMEVWFNYGEGMKLAGMESVSELGEGDQVFVVYDQAPNNTKHVKEITLLKKKPAEQAEPAEAEEM
jgi:hypothetical protein